MSCGKRCFVSSNKARRAGRYLYSFKLRTYWCGECRSWHVTAVEKR